MGHSGNRLPMATTVMTLRTDAFKRKYDDRGTDVQAATFAKADHVSILRAARGRATVFLRTVDYDSCARPV